jgi:hypothetical protein
LHVTGALPDFFIRYANVLSQPPVDASFCSGSSNCESYFFSGGLQSLSPNPIFFRSTSPEADAIILEGEQGLHVDYWDVDPSDGKADVQTDCLIWIGSSEAAGFMICLAPSRLNANHLVAGITIRQRMSYEQEWLSVPL